MTNKFAAALFDLDGVVFDTEPQYTVYWGGVMRKFRPDTPGLEYTIKGSTLTRIFEDFLPDVPEADPAPCIFLPLFPAR